MPRKSTKKAGADLGAHGAELEKRLTALTEEVRLLAETVAALKAQVEDRSE